jgi:hypothetical protein
VPGPHRRTFPNFKIGRGSDVASQKIFDLRPAPIQARVPRPQRLPALRFTAARSLEHLGKVRAARMAVVADARGPLAVAIGGGLVFPVDDFAVEPTQFDQSPHGAVSSTDLRFRAKIRPDL